MSIVGSRVNRGGRDWDVASVVRAGHGLRIILRAVDDPECKIVAAAPSALEPMRAADLDRALACPRMRTFRGPEGALWRVEPAGGAQSEDAPGRWLVFVSETGSTRARIELESLRDIGTLSDDDLTRLLFHARRGSAADLEGAKK